MLHNLHLGWSHRWRISSRYYVKERLLRVGVGPRRSNGLSQVMRRGWVDRERTQYTQ